MTEPRPPDTPDDEVPDDEIPEDMVSVSLAERLADDQARRAADRARMPSFFFGVMFAAAIGGLFLRDAGGGWGGGEDAGLSGSGLDVADAALMAFAALAAALGVFGEDRIRYWLARGRDKVR